MVRGWQINGFEFSNLHCPFGGGRCLWPHLDVLTKLPDILTDDFGILMDHIEEENGLKAFHAIKKILESRKKVYIERALSSAGHQIGLLASEKLRYVEEY